MGTDNLKENIILTSGKFKEERDYWKDKLGDDFIIGRFPEDIKKNDLNKPNKAVINFNLPDKVTKDLISMSNNSDIGLYMILLCGVKYLLYRYTDNNDIVVGMPTFKQGGEDSRTDSRISALRTKIDPNWNFKDLLLDVKKSVSYARKYTNITFEMISDTLGLKDEYGDSPKIKTIVSLKNIQDISREDQINAEMIFSFAKIDENIKLEIEYDPDLFFRSTVESLVTNVTNFFTEVCDKTKVNLLEIDIFEEKDKNQVLYDFNNTAVSFSEKILIQDMFEEQVKKTPEKVALVSKGDKLTYKQLNEKSNQIACLLRNKGVKTESVVGIMIERSFDMVAGILGILKAGGAYLPIDPEYPGDRIKYMLNDSGAQILLTKNRFMHYVSFDKESVYLDDEELSDIDTSNLEAQSTFENLAYVIYTSGSTGEPKGVGIEHKSVFNFIKGVTDRIQFKPESSILALTTICFDIAVLELLLPLTQGLKVVIADESEQLDPRKLNNIIINEEIDMIQLTPSRMQYMLSSGEHMTCMNNIKVIMLGGEVFPQTLLDSIREVTKARIYNMYGPIETTIWSTIKEIGEDGQVNIGKPIANTRIYVVSKNKSLQKVGIPGELCIAGEGLARGYINKPELTNERFTLNPFSTISGDRIYHTGDLAKWLPDGNIEFLGREDYQVKIRGFRIELGEIESTILKCEGIKNVAVVDKTDSNNNRYIAAYVVVDEGVNFIEIKDYISKKLPNYMLPTNYRKLDKLPLTQNGKIDRRALRMLDDLSVKTAYVAPRTDLEKKIVDIWQDVLKVERIGIDDDIEELGGNSFLAMRLEITMEMEDLEVTNLEIFQNRNIRKLAELIEKKQNGELKDNDKLI